MVCSMQCHYTCHSPLSSDQPSVPSSSSSQSRATTADKGPSPEVESLPTTQQGMLHSDFVLMLIGEWGIPPSAALTCYQVCVPCVFPFHEAVQVLDLFRDQFIEEVDANAVIWELCHRGIISEGDKNKLTQFDEPRQCNQFLHRTLVQKCTEEAFEIVCDIITAVDGNPKMKALGESMKRRLETSGYMCVCGGGGRDCVHVVVSVYGSVVCNVHGCVCC